MAMTTTMTTSAYQVASTSDVPVHEPADRDGREQQRDEDEDGGLGERRQVLGLPVPVRVAAVGRAHRHADREERQERGHQVGAGVRRLREEAEAARGQARHELERDQDDGGRDRDERDPALGAHRVQANLGRGCPAPPDTGETFTVECPHCGKSFEAPLLGETERNLGFKCPHCRLLVAYKPAAERDDLEPTG